LFIQSKSIVLKMSENKKEIHTFWNFIIKKGRTRLKLLKKLVMLRDIMQYQYV